MTTYGLTPEGFVLKTLEVLRDEINADLRAAFGSSLDLSDKSIEGIVVGIFSASIAELWELMEAVNASQNPDAATGEALEALAALTGTLRLPAIETTATLTLTGSPASIVPAESRAATSAATVEFATISAVTIASVDAWIAETPYDAGDRVTNSARVYECTGAGTSDVAVGPSTTDEIIYDDSATWTYLGEGTGVAEVLAQATATGPLIAAARDITSIVTPVGGWQSVINLLDADPGRDIETDASLRVRREIELAAAGKSTAAAIRSDILDVLDVTSVRVFVNNTDVTDADGVPPHAIEVMVEGGDSQDIWDALLGSIPAGIATFGGQVGSAEDSTGVSHVMRFSRPDTQLIFVEIELIVDPVTYPATGDDLVKQAIVDYGDSQLVGKDVVAARIAAAAFTVLGVLDVPNVFIGLSIDPTLSTTLVMSTRDLAMYDTSLIEVTTADGEP